MEIFYVLDASAFINGFQLDSKNNFTVPEITFEIKDFESRLKFDEAIDENRLIIQDVPEKYLKLVDEIISKSGDSLRLSFPDKKLISLAYMMYKEGNNVKVTMVVPDGFDYSSSSYFTTYISSDADKFVKSMYEIMY